MSEGTQLVPIARREARDKTPASFAQWLVSTGDWFEKGIALGIVVLFITGSVFLLHPGRWIAERDLNRFLNQDLGLGRALLALFQAIACFLLAVLILKPDSRPKPLSTVTGEREPVEDINACRRIRGWLGWIYLAFFVYYTVTCFRLLTSAPAWQAFYNVLLMTLNTVQGGLLFVLYLDLAEPTGKEPALNVTTSENNSLYDQYGRKLKNRSVLSVNASDAGFQRAVCVGVFAMIVVPAWYCYLQDRLIPGFDIASACLTGVALALVVGRLGLLESRAFEGTQRIGPGALALGFLYFYAVIQPVAASFAENPRIHVLATSAAVPLKVLLWLVGVWALNTGIFAEYVRRIRTDAGPGKEQGEN